MYVLRAHFEAFPQDTQWCFFHGALFRSVEMGVARLRS